MTNRLIKYRKKTDRLAFKGQALRILRNKMCNATKTAKDTTNNKLPEYFFEFDYVNNIKNAFTKREDI